ncbi:sterol desaturase family protein [Aquimarina sp. M1]
MTNIWIKNYSEIFIIWDKLFGSFREELKNTPPVYGVKKPVNTWNPFLINFMYLWGIAKDAWHTKNWKDKLKIWVMPTGWRPNDVTAKYPIEIIEDPYSRVKYSGNDSYLLKVWSWIQLQLPCC